MRLFRRLLPLLILAAVARAAAPEPERIRDVIYAKHDGVALTFDLVKPAKPNGAAIIRVMSGGWKSGHRNMGAGPWPDAGYTTFVVTHGSQPRFHIGEISRDILRAVRFIRTHAAEYGVDPQKLGITGGSAGGHLSLMVATHGGPGDPAAADPVDRASSAVQAVACYYPPTDLLNWSAEGDVAVGVGGLSWLAGAFGTDALTPLGRARLGREASPIYRVHAGQPPVFMVHGDADTVVPLYQAEKFFERSRAVGAACELLVRRGAGHGGWKEMREDDARMVEWFDLHLLGRAPARPFALAVTSLPSTTPAPKPVRPPNIVVILADDLGYGDLGSYGAPNIRTPHLDRMAAEGLRFTDFYSGAEVCTPSRTALLTGRYPVRSGMAGPRRRVLFPDSPGGLPPAEITLAEALRERGYATGHIGKWHLGVHPGSQPQDQGFDHTLNLPYSNDMDARPGLPRGAASSANPPADGWNVPLLRNGVIVERPVDQTKLTAVYTAEAVTFIEEQKDRPFFLYIAHAFPHVPLFASPAFLGKSRGGIYGDTVEELDASVGAVLEALRARGLAENTLVFFTSDNGPWLTQNQQGGSAGALREGKGSTWEGGVRVPGLAWWPGKIGPAVSGDPAGAMDIFPTALALARGTPAPDRPLDGRNLTPVLFGQKTRPEEPLFFYRGDALMAVRLGRWKAHIVTRSSNGKDAAEVHATPLLFDLGRDPAERFDVAAENPEVVARLLAALTAHRASIIPVTPQVE